MTRPLRGFSDSQTPFSAAAEHRDQAVRPAGKLTIGSGGRLVIPADVRALLGLREGDALVATVVDGELRLMPVATAVQRAQAYVRATVGTVKESVVDEFLREKRAEQALEDLKG